VRVNLEAGKRWPNFIPLPARHIIRAGPENVSRITILFTAIVGSWGRTRSRDAKRASFSSGPTRLSVTVVTTNCDWVDRTPPVANVVGRTPSAAPNPFLSTPGQGPSQLAVTAVTAQMFVLLNNPASQFSIRRRNPSFLRPSRTVVVNSGGTSFNVLGPSAGEGRKPAPA
jgi:hypothetical protein